MVVCQNYHLSLPWRLGAFDIPWKNRMNNCSFQNAFSITRRQQNRVFSLNSKILPFTPLFCCCALSMILQLTSLSSILKYRTKVYPHNLSEKSSYWFGMVQCNDFLAFFYTFEVLAIIFLLLFAKKAWNSFLLFHFWFIRFDWSFVLSFSRWFW